MRERIGLVVYDVAVGSLAASARARAIRKYFSHRGLDVHTYAAKADPPDNYGQVTIVRDHFRGGFVRNLVTRIFGMPDPFVFWSIRVFFQLLLDRIRGRLPRVLIVTSPPHGIQLIALLSSLLLGRVVVSDLRDIFVNNHRAKWPTRIHRLAAKALEALVIQHSKLIILNTQVALRMYESSYPRAFSRLACITNGYESERGFEGRVGEPGARPRIVAYIGSDYSGFAPQTISRVLDLLKASADGSWSVVTAGPGDWSLAVKYDEWTHLGLIAPDEADYVARSADYCLLLMPPGERVPSPTVPLKTYQYLATDSTIIYLGETGAVTELLLAYPGTLCFPRDALVDLVGALKEPTCYAQPFKRDVKHLSFEYLVNELADRVQSL